MVIGEETDSAYIEDVDVVITGKSERMGATYEALGAYVTGPVSEVEQLEKDGITVTVDVAGLEEGYYLITPTIDASRYPKVNIQTEALSLTLTDLGQDG